MPTGSDHYVISYDDAITAHEIVLGVSGGRSGILSEASLLSALARPYCGYFEPLEEKAAVLMEAIVQNHGFVDGNKRSAVFLAFAMIQLSGFEIMPNSTDDDIDLQMEDMAVALAEGGIKADTIIAWLRPRIKPM